ncbi:MAG: DUF1646 family protein [Chloroflexota bacterium]|nr:DUF1646 family protein [Chloroflexota bacterium]
MPELVVGVLLGIVFVLILVLPFFVKRAEHNLELFLLIMGVLSVTAAWAWELEVVKDAVTHPLMITGAVLGAGALAHLGREHLKRWLLRLLAIAPLPAVVGAMVGLLGLLSSFITAIIAGILLAEFLSIMPLSRRSRINVAVLGCFAIGLGAALTPVGEPLSTIVIQKLQGPPHNADFFFLARLLGIEILVGIVVAAAISRFFVQHDSPSAEVDQHDHPRETWVSVPIRAAKVYVFVAALTLLGAGFSVVVDKYLAHVPGPALYWANVSSAVLDNATLAAAEIGPSLHVDQIRDVVLALMIAGVILIPGNIPNIITASQLRISMKEWARLGVPLGFGALLVGFLTVLFL